MSGHAQYCNAPDLARYGEISKGAPVLAEKFFAWYGAVCEEGNTLSVGFDGTVYDCFNQVLELPVVASAPRTIFDTELVSLGERAITVGPHCFGCTAAACGGATA